MFFVGKESGRDNTTGGGNTFLGLRAGQSNLSGTSNTFVGNNAGILVNQGSANTFLGVNAGRGDDFDSDGIIGGINNSFFGATTGTNNDESSFNTFFGFAAGNSHYEGNSNTMLGNQSGTLHTEGQDNTFVGSESGSRIIRGSGNVVIGSSAGPTPQPPNAIIDNELYIGNPSSGTPLIWGDFDPNARKVIINGDASALPPFVLGCNINDLTFYVNGCAGGSTGWAIASDERLKENIKSIESPLEKILALRGVTFEWKDKTTFPDGSQIGFIAQEAKDIIPEVVSGSMDSSYNMQYAPVTALLVEAVKEQQSQIDTLNDRVKRLETLILQMRPELEKDLDQSDNGEK